MTERKPHGISWESWIERKIREAQEKGEFDNLPGAGKPIPGLRGPHDPYWWVKQLLTRENLSVTPATLQVRKKVEEALARIRKAKEENTVRVVVAELNELIEETNAKATHGPPTDLAPLDPDKVVAQWRAKRC